MLKDVSIFDNLQTFLVFSVELLVQIVNGLRFLPRLLNDSAQLLNRYLGIFPGTMAFIATFLLGAGIITKLS